MPGRRLGAAVLLLALAHATGAAAAEPDVRQFPVTSEPPGAVVTSIVGELGVTPLEIDERSIYPNEFPPDQLDLYGKLVISRPGCSTVTHAVTLAEVGSGVAVALDCRKPSQPLRTEVLGGVSPAAPAALPDPASAEPVAERRLRQLRVLDELLQEGLLSTEEERSIRQRILAQ